MPSLGHCDSAVGAPYLNTLNNASRAERRVNDFANGKGALSVARVNLGNRTSKKKKRKIRLQPHGYEWDCYNGWMCGSMDGVKRS